MHNQIEKTGYEREHTVRCALSRHGYKLKKVPARHWEKDYYGVGYMVTDDRNCVVIGAGSREYDGTLQQCEWLLERLEQQIAP